MNARVFTLFGILCLAGATPAHAQEIDVAPFLQSPTPTSMWIIWETSSGAESRVEWGTTNALGSSTTGSDHEGNAGSRIHEVALTALSPATRYFYQVHTGSAASRTYDFVTPPAPGSAGSFRFVAMSDMQRDGGNPEKFREIISEGILDYVRGEYGPNLTDELALLLVPGDLVADGRRYAEWEETYFDPGMGLFEHVAQYPVTGNHEHDTEHYFSYFHLPNNGSPGNEEHWYHADYGNVRIIGLDSNDGYQNDTQLSWLDAVLDAACSDEHIDFVFAQLHHPFLSELWKPGETAYTGEVVQRLEQFSTMCGKPSIHLFGHTHGYSRGQSRDHQHLWVNVATAGGNIDYWGEYAGQEDYSEFTVSEDEYGFVILEVTSGESPSFHLRRISRGDEEMTRNNEVRDDITIRRNNAVPARPTALGPTGDEVPVSCTTLVASPFSDADEGDGHHASHWQLSQRCDDWSALEHDSWKQSENRYNEVDRQEGDDLTNDEVTSLRPNTDYCMRVRYRDGSLGWSEWSEPLSFRTGAATGTSNMLTNPGAEDGTAGWTAREGVVESITDGECGGVAPYAGMHCFALGVCAEAPMSTASQRVDLSTVTGLTADEIDAGEVTLVFGGYLRDFGGEDEVRLYLIALDADGEEQSRSETLTNRTTDWTRVSSTLTLPAGTRSVDLVLQGERNAGTDNDAYLDDLFVRRDSDEEPAECGGREPPTMDAGVSPADGGGSRVDAGPADTGNSDEDAGAEEDTGGATPEPEDSGCSCRVGAATNSSKPWTLLLALALMGLRRARSRRTR